MRALNCYLNMHFLSRTPSLLHSDVEAASPPPPPTTSTPSHPRRTSTSNQKNRRNSLSTVIRSSTMPGRIRKKSRSSTALLEEQRRVGTVPLGLGLHGGDERGRDGRGAPQLPPILCSPPLEKMSSNGEYVEVFETPRCYPSGESGASEGSVVVSPSGVGGGGRISSGLGNGNGKVQFAVVSKMARRYEEVVDGLGEGLGGKEKEKLRELVERFGIGEVRGSWRAGIKGEGRDELIKRMFLDNIIVALARLERHEWILGGGESGGLVCTDDRWDMMHEDLLRYTKAIKVYEDWSSSKIHTTDPDRFMLPPTFQSYSQALALVDLASHPASQPTSETLDLLNTLSQNLLFSHHRWSASRALKPQTPRKTALFWRTIWATLAGLTLIAPMLIMVLVPTRASRLAVASSFIFVTGASLALCPAFETREVLLWTVSYAAVLVVFVGCATGVL